jgi:hypothetical protein
MRWVTGWVLVAMSLASCGDDATTTPTTTPTTTTTTTTTPTTTTTTTTTTPVALEQPAVWPAAHMVVATPEQAAADFVEQVLGVPAVLGEFQQGDQRSGEIEVFLAGENEASATLWPRAILFLRQLGPADGWFVIGAASEHVTIATPRVGDVVSAGPLTVEGMGRGFEATLVVAAFVPGNPEPLDLAVTFGGALDIAEPYRAQLDLSNAPSGVVAILTRGGVGLETDPGEFSVIPVTLTRP